MHDIAARFGPTLPIRERSRRSRAPRDGTERKKSCAPARKTQKTGPQREKYILRSTDFMHEYLYSHKRCWCTRSGWREQRHGRWISRPCERICVMLPRRHGCFSTITRESAFEIVTSQSSRCWRGTHHTTRQQHGPG